MDDDVTVWFDETETAENHGTIAVGYGHREDGTICRFYAEPRLLADAIREVLATGEGVALIVPRWAVS